MDSKACVYERAERSVPAMPGVGEITPVAAEVDAAGDSTGRVEAGVGAEQEIKDRIKRASVARRTMRVVMGFIGADYTNALHETERLKSALQELL
jgi:hypothetical protein